MSKFITIPLLLLSSISLIACGGGSGSNSKDEDDSPQGNSNNPQNSPPIVSIIAASSVDERSTTNLDGGGSDDSDGTIASYLWTVEMEEGLAVELTHATTSTPLLIVNELTEDTEITITLKITDDDGATSETDKRIFLNEIDIDLLPPDPGTASLDTLEGIDSDQNGVRDDVEIAIYRLHEDNFENREILKGGANAIQNAIIASTTAGDGDNDSASELIAKFAYCLSELSSMDRSKHLAILKSLQINTSERKAAYDAYNQSRHGTIQRVVRATLDECMTIESQGGN